MTLSPEIRKRIYEEERFRAEARTRAQEEIRLRQQSASFFIRALLMVGLFALSYFASNMFLARVRAVPEVNAPVQPALPELNQSVLDDVARVLTPEVDATVCVRTVGRKETQVKATIELTRPTARDAARRLAMTKARAVGAALRRRGLAVPAYVEIFSPERWYGVALYDRDSLRVTWDPCPGQCEQEGTYHVRHCQPSAEPQEPTARP